MLRVNPDSKDNPNVAVAMGASTYEASAPYSPGTPYPEYPFGVAGVGTENNHAYDLVRKSLELLALDAARYGRREWNPLGGIVRPGDTVVLKPNLVRDFRETSPDHADCLITHGSIIRAVLDYVFLALKAEGRIVIADAPQNDADFGAIRRITGLDEIQAFYRENADFNVEVYDLRPERTEKIDGVIVGHEPLPGDPAGYTKVNLGTRSAFAEINHLCHLLYGSEYDTSELYSHQHDDVHEYLVSRTVLEADCVIGLPKLKTHKKVGLTVNMKNLVGINGNKNWLPHHRQGTPAQGGDEFSENGMKRRIERTTVTRFKQLFPLLGPLRPLLAAPIKALGKTIFGDTNTDTIRSGNWYGNDTTWRMVLDLNRVLLYADAKGVLRQQPVRRFFSVVDGIMAGEGNGPLDPARRPLGTVLAGFNPVSVDLVAARIMGFDYEALPVLHRALEDHDLPLTSFEHRDVVAISNDRRLDGKLAELQEWDARFRPHFGWKGHIELAVRENDPVGDLIAGAVRRG